MHVVSQVYSFNFLSKYGAKYVKIASAPALLKQSIDSNIESSSFRVPLFIADHSIEYSPET